MTDLVTFGESMLRLSPPGHQRLETTDELDVPPDQLDWSLEDEVEFLLIHGLLHLVGHDHKDPDEEREMKAAERRLWEASR
mgnify:CR=1 FL=1